jgi:hypothetical protein
MSILTILLALLLGGTGSSNVQITSGSDNGPVMPSPFIVSGGGPTSGPAANAGVKPSSPIGSPLPYEVSGGGPTI